LNAKEGDKMYSISQYGKMYTNQARMNAYAAALRAVVRPNSVVLDIGAGTGFFALLACHFGARRVYAIEPEDVITLAQDMAAGNDCSDRLTCIQSLSTEVTLRERADIIISDLSGRLPLFGGHIAAIADARDRLLVPGGTLIARQDQIRVSVVEAAQLHQELTRPWSKSLCGLDLSAGWPLVANTLTTLTDKNARFLTTPSTLAVLDYQTINDSNLDGEVSWVIEHPNTGNGVAIWFDRIVYDGIRISNEPNAPEAINTSDIYGQCFFPWPRPVNLKSGDQIHVRIKANLVKDEYIWRWETTILAGQETKARFQQSTLHGSPMSSKSLVKFEADRIITPNENTRIDAFILSRLDGQASLRQIAEALAADFPTRFDSWNDALSRVVHLAGRY
jgi:protein arginine N-methyltransferase 1